MVLVGSMAGSTNLLVGTVVRLVFVGVAGSTNLSWYDGTCRCGREYQLELVRWYL